MSIPFPSQPPLSSTPKVSSPPHLLTPLRILSSFPTILLAPLGLLLHNDTLNNPNVLQFLRHNLLNIGHIRLDSLNLRSVELNRLRCCLLDKVTGSYIDENMFGVGELGRNEQGRSEGDKKRLVYITESASFLSLMNWRHELNPETRATSLRAASCGTVEHATTMRVVTGGLGLDSSLYGVDVFPEAVLGFLKLGACSHQVLDFIIELLLDRREVVDGEGVEVDCCLPLASGSFRVMRIR
jgi:hypothetical protein